MLLSDPEAVIIKVYKSWGKKKLMGREYGGTPRHTFPINPVGWIVKQYQGSDPSMHAVEILTDLQRLQSVF